MNPKTAKVYRHILISLALASAIGTILAQQAPLPPPADSSQDVIELSPFVVDDTRDVGYLAQNTLAGSRLNTALKDTPASISVMTPEFLSDIGAFQLEEALPYALNVEFYQDDDRAAINGNATIQNYQTYRVRGLDASVSRNYFAWNGPAIPSESAFVERIEDSRGPNAVLFGIASPGGVIDTSTKQPRLGRDFYKGSFTLGSYESKRAAVDVNQTAFNGKMAVRLNLVYNDNNDFRHWEFQKHQRALLGVKYQLTERTIIRAELERGQLDSNKARSYTLDNRFLKWNSLDRPTFDTIPSAAIRTANGLGQLSNAANQPRVTFIANNEMAISMRGRLNTTGDAPEQAQTPGGGVIGSGVITDTSIADYSVNIGGPAQGRSSRYGIFSAFLQHQFGRNTHMEVAYNHFEHSFDNRDPRQDSPNGLKGDPNQLLLNGAPNPYAGQLYLETNWFRTVRWSISDTGRASFSHEYDAGKWGNYRMAALADYDKSWALTRTYREFWVDSATGLPAFNVGTPENAQNNVWRRNYVTEFDWATYHTGGPIGSGGLISGVTDPVTGRTLNSAWLRQNYPSETFTTQKGAMVALQARYFEGRLIAAVGFRRDEVDMFELARWRDPATNLRSITRDPAYADANQEAGMNSATGKTKTLGLVYHVTPKISLYYNQADNINLPARGAETLPPSGEPGDPIPAPAPEGEGKDIGIGLDLFDGRIYAKATYYETKGVDQSTTSPSQVRSTNIRIMDALLDAGLITTGEHDLRINHGGEGLYDHESEGLELQITANPIKDWRVQVNLAKADAVESNKFVEWLNWDKLNVEYLSQFDIENIVTTDDGDTIADEIAFYQEELRSQTEAVGIGKLGNRRYKVSLFTRYDFSEGLLKGAYVGGGYKHQSKMFAGLDAAGNVVHTNSFWRADLVAGYRVSGLSKGRALSFQLNVFNVFNERDPLVTRMQDDGVSIFRNVVQPPTTWRFTTNFEF